MTHVLGFGRAMPALQMMAEAMRNGVGVMPFGAVNPIERVGEAIAVYVEEMSRPRGGRWRALARWRQWARSGGGPIHSGIPGGPATRMTSRRKL